MVQYTASQTSLVKSPSSMTEMYIPLWVYSSGTSSTTSVSVVYLQKGTTTAATGVTSAVNLHTLNSSWPSTQKFAFEAALYSSSASGTAYVTLRDMTANGPVVSSQLSTTSTTSNVLRSSQFTLTPGHVYGVTISSSSASYAAYVSKAHLVAFL